MATTTIIGDEALGMITVEFSCNGPAAAGGLGLQKLRIPISKETTVKEATLEAVKRLSKIRSCTASEIRVADVTVDGASLFGADRVVAVVDIKRESMRVVLAEPLVVAHRDMFVIQQRPLHSERSTDLLSAPPQPQPRQLAPAAHDRSKGSAAQHRLPCDPLPSESVFGAAREPSVDVSSGQSSTSARDPRSKDSKRNEEKKAARVRKALPAAAPSAVPKAEPPLRDARSLPESAKARGAKRCRENDCPTAEPVRTGSSRSAGLDRRVQTAASGLSTTPSLSTAEPSVVSRADDASQRAVLAAGRELGWGSKAAEYFDPSYVSNPDAIVRLKRKQMRMEKEAAKERERAQAQTTQAEKICQLPPAATTVISDIDATAAKEVRPSECTEVRTTARVLFEPVDEAAESRTPRAPNRRRELGWGTEAAEHFSPLYTSDPTRMSPRTCKTLSELPRELRHRVFPSAH